MDYSLLYYRYGFLVAERKSELPLASNAAMIFFSKWNKSEIGNYVLHTHPEASIIRAKVKSTDVILIGSAFSHDYLSVSSALEFLDVDAPWRTLDDICGRYVILLINEDGCRVVNDAFGSRSVFYTSDGPFICSSHSALLANMTNCKRDDRISSVMRSNEYRSRSVKYLPGDFTPYKGIYSLTPNNMLMPDGSTYRYWPRSPRIKENNLDMFYKEIVRYYKGFVPFCMNHNTPVFGITGGVDSRAVSCAFTAAGAEIFGVTWGKPWLDEVELPSIENQIDGLGIPHAFIYLETVNTSHVAGVAGRNSGNFRDNSRLAEAMFRFQKVVPKPLFIRGYGGEILRGFYNLHKKPLQDFSTKELARGYDSSVRNARRTEPYKELVCSLFEEFRERANYRHLDKFDYSPSDIFYWEHRMGSWGAAMLNEMDVAMPSIVGINSRSLYESALALPDDMRLNKAFLKNIVTKIDPRYGQIPYG